MKERVTVLQYYGGEGKVAGQLAGFLVPFERVEVERFQVDKNGNVSSKKEQKFNCLCLLCGNEKLLSTKRIYNTKSCGCIMTRIGRVKAAEIRPTLADFEKTKKISKKVVDGRKK